MDGTRHVVPGAPLQVPGAPGGMCTVQRLRMQEFERFFVDLHILPK
jgi:hypothetical protein